MIKFTIYTADFQFALSPKEAVKIESQGISADEIWSRYLSDMDHDEKQIAQFDNKEDALYYANAHFSSYAYSCIESSSHRKLVTGRLVFMEAAQWEWDEDAEEWVFYEGSDYDPIFVEKIEERENR